MSVICRDYGFGTASGRAREKICYGRDGGVKFEVYRDRNKLSAINGSEWDSYTKAWVNS